MAQVMEFLEILDENGVSTGIPEQRSIIHQKGLWHRAVIVAIVNRENKVLIQKRSSTKEKFPGLWDLSVAGHVPFGHDSLSCAAMEVMEEIGTMLKKDVNLKDFRFLTSFRNTIKVSENFIENQFYDFFAYNADIALDQFHIQKEEVEEVKYVTAYEIKEMVEQNLFHPRTQWVNVLYNYITKF